MKGKRLRILLGTCAILLPIAVWMNYRWMQTRSRLSPAAQHYERGVEFERRGQMEQALAAWHTAARLDPNYPEPHRKLGDFFLDLNRGNRADLAVGYFRHLMRIDPDGAHVPCKLAQALSMLGETDEALAAAQMAVKREPNCPLAHTALGVASLDQRLSKQARFHLEEAHRLAPDDVKTALILAQGYLTLTDPAAAQRLLMQLLREHPQHPRVHLFLGQVYAAGPLTPDNVESALQHFRQAAQWEPDLPEVHREMGKLLLQTGRLAEAKTTLERAWELTPRSVEVAFHLAAVYRRLDENEKADKTEAEFKRLSELENRQRTLTKQIRARPDDMRLVVELAEVELERGNLRTAQRHVAAVLRQQPDHHRARDLLQRIADEARRTAPTPTSRQPDQDPTMARLRAELSLENYESMLARYQRKVKEHPDDAEAHVSLGLLLAQRGEMEKAFPALQRAVRLGARQAIVHHNLGLVYSRRGEIERAAEEFRQEINLAPQQPSGYLSLGMMLKRLGQLPPALDPLKKAVELDPNLSLARYEMGHAWFLLGSYERAITALRRCVELEPDNALAQYWLGRACLSQARHDEAGRCFERAAQLKPDDARYHHALGTTYLQRAPTAENLEKAQRAFEKAIALEPASAHSYFGLGMTERRRGRLDEAVKRLKKALQLAPDMSDAQYALVQTLKESGRDKEAAEQLRQLQTRQAAARKEARLHALEREALNNPQQPQVRYQLGCFYQDEMKDNRRAAQELEATVRLDPEFLPAHERLVKVYEALGRRREASQQRKVVQRLKAEKKGGAR